MASNRPRDEMIEINKLSFHIREWGDSKTKQAVILLHGYAETMAVWNDVAPDLAREFRVIAIDQRGHGETANAPDQDYSRNSQMEDLELVVEHLGLRMVTLIGHAMGGANAICYAAEHPEGVSALILVETAPEVLRSGIEQLRRLLATSDEFATLDEAIEGFREFLPYATNEQLERRVRASLVPSDAGAYVWAFDPVFRDPLARPPEPDTGQRRLADLWECADRVQCPTMIVRGAETDMLTPEAIQRIHRRIVGSRVSLIEDAGHSVPTDQPSSLALNIREFLQSLASLA